MCNGSPFCGVWQECRDQSNAKAEKGSCCPCHTGPSGTSTNVSLGGKNMPDINKVQPTPVDDMISRDVFFEDIMAGFKELEEYARGEKTLTVSTVSVPSPKSNDQPIPSLSELVPNYFGCQSSDAMRIVGTVLFLHVQARAGSSRPQMLAFGG